MRKVTRFLLLITLHVNGSTAPAAEQWEADMQKFAELDRLAPPLKGAVLFVGSSSIVKWDLPRYFPEWQCINRGFGGSQIADSVRYVDQIVTPYQPRAIVFYAGDNDIAARKSLKQVAEDFRLFVIAVRRKLPKTPIMYIGIKPSIQRWALIDKIRAANSMIESQCREGDKLTFLNVEPVMLDQDGLPKRELFVADGLHLSATGYQLWSDLVKQHLADQ